jgi:glycosyltransferase involved in cell wall biosynthesis
MRLISVVTPCYNEQENVREVYDRVKGVFAKLGKYRYEHIFIDNASRDGTVEILRQIASADRNVKVIVNTRNFGQVRSPFHALLAARGDAVVGLAADLQDPPELIPAFLEQWEAGYKVALGVKAAGEESWPMAWIRDGYYRLLARLSDVEPVRNSTGFGLCDREVIEIIREMNEPYPYFRGLLPEIGFPIARIEYEKPLRKRGKTKNNFYTLFDLAMLGITTHSKVPLRMATIGGFALSALSLFVALAYLVAKLLFWYRFSAGIAPILIGLFVTFSVQLFFLGLLGEYVSAVHTQMLRRPLVVERERINFEDADVPALPTPLPRPAVPAEKEATWKT